MVHTALERKHTHVQTSGNAGSLQGLLLGVLAPGSHQTRHLILGEFNLTATEGRETDVGDFELVGWGRHCGGRNCREGRERRVEMSRMGRRMGGE